MILPRNIQSLFARSLESMPVVVLMGARQTGKSTFVRDVPALAPRPYITLDDLDHLQHASTQPESLLALAPELVLDEVQRVPELILRVKQAVDMDRPRRPGRFVLTGSANLLLMKQVQETLAGRASYVTVWPMTVREQRGLGTAGSRGSFFDAPVEEWYDLAESLPSEPEDWRALAPRGGYPTPALELETAEQRRIWHAGYAQTYLERDLPQLSGVDNILDFRRLMRIACLRVGNLMNKSEMARDAGLSQPTAHRYLGHMVTSYQLIELGPYSANRTSRLVKSPKAYWSDTGLAMFLSDEVDPRGAHFENLVLNDLVSWRDGQVSNTAVSYWRRRTGEEVDFVVEHPKGVLAVEVKSGRRARAADARNITRFRNEHARQGVLGGLVLYEGAETFWLAKEVLAVPWWKVL